MKISFNLKSKFQKKKKFLFGFFILTLILSFTFPFLAHGGILETILHRIKVAILTGLPRLWFAWWGIIIYLWNQLMLAYVIAAEAILRWVISGGVTNWAYTQPGRNPIIALGLQITMPLTNLILMIAILIIALATILRIQSYEMKKLLPTFFIIAILVNFTPVILGFIVDVGNALMNFFFFHTKDVEYGAFQIAAQRAFQPARFWACMKALFILYPEGKGPTEFCIKGKEVSECAQACKQRGLPEFSCKTSCSPLEIFAEEGSCKAGLKCCCQKYKGCEEACQDKGYKIGMCSNQPPVNNLHPSWPWYHYLEGAPCKGVGGPYCYCKKYENCREACKVTGYKDAECMGDKIGDPRPCEEKGWIFLPEGPCEGPNASCCCRSPTTSLEKFSDKNLIFFKRAPPKNLFILKLLGIPKAKADIEPTAEEEGVTETLHTLFSIFTSMVFRGSASGFFMVIVFYTLLIYSALFIIRHFAIWILTILAPIAIVCFIFPKTRGFFGMWQKQFLFWVLVGVVGAFFTYLGAMVVATSTEFYQIDPASKLEGLYIPIPSTKMEELVLSLRTWVESLSHKADEIINWFRDTKAIFEGLGMVLRPFPLVGEIGKGLLDLSDFIGKKIIPFFENLKAEAQNWVSKLTGPEKIEEFTQWLKAKAGWLKGLFKTARDVINGILDIINFVTSLPGIGPFVKKLLGPFITFLENIRDFAQNLVDFADQMIQFGDALKKYVILEKVPPQVSESAIRDILNSIIPVLPGPLFLLLGLYFVLKTPAMFAGIVAAKVMGWGKVAAFLPARKGAKALKWAGKKTGRAIERKARLPERAARLGERVERMPIVGPAIAVPFKRYGARIEADIKKGEEYAKRMSRIEAARAVLRNQYRNPFVNLGLVSQGKIDYQTLLSQGEKMGYKGVEAHRLVQRTLNPIFNLGKTAAPEKVSQILKNNPQFARLSSLRQHGETGAQAIARVTKGMTASEWTKLSPGTFKDRAVSEAFLKNAPFEAYERMPAGSRKVIQEEINKRGQKGIQGTKLAEFIQNSEMEMKLYKAGWKVPEEGEVPKPEEIEKETIVKPVPETKIEKAKRVTRKVARAATLGAALVAAAAVPEVGVPVVGYKVAKKYVYPPVRKGFKKLSDLLKERKEIPEAFEEKPPVKKRKSLGDFFRKEKPPEAF